jgi:tRNA(Arg) A34 adenosine deaminase TadA
MSMNRRIVSAALTSCKKSNFSKPMGCVIYRGKKVISEGANMIMGSGKATLHAEQNAIEQILRRHGLLRPFRHIMNKLPVTREMFGGHMDTLSVMAEPACRQGR